MPLENLTGNDVFIGNLNEAWPLDGDYVDEGDDHVRGVKNVLKNQFPNLGADPVTATASQLNNFMVPVGAILDYAGGGAPAGWYLCDGSPLSRAAFPVLFQAIGVTWGAGDGSTTFNIPDLRGFAAIGSGVDYAYAGGPGPLAGNKGGAPTVIITVPQLPGHTHTINLAASTGGVSNINVGGIGDDIAASVESGPAGEAQGHLNMQPSAVVTKIIRAA